jgi:FKBP-type peptidyl-prolyl cis-trans isomerase 2
MRHAWLAALISIMCLAAPAAGAEQEPAEVGEGSSIKVHYTLTVDGKEVDSSRDGKPLEVTVGQRQVIPGFEKALVGMKPGDRKSFTVDPEEGYGPLNPDAIQEVPREQLPADLDVQPGMVLYAKGPEGQAIPVQVMEVKGETVVMSFNHPLAGKTLHFDIELVEIL